MRKKLVTLALLAMPITSFGADNNWYVGAMLGQSDADMDVTATTNSTVDETDTGIGWVLGYSVTNNVSLEGHYFDGGEVTLNWRNGGTITSEGTTLTNNTGVDINATIETSTMGLGIIAHGDKSNVVVPFVKAGWHSWDSESRVSVAGTDFATEKEDGTDPFYGIGIMWRLNDEISLRGEYTSYEFDDTDVTFAGIGIVLGF